MLIRSWYTPERGELSKSSARTGLDYNRPVGILPATLLRQLETASGPRLLVIRLSAFGDILRTLPAVRLLKSRFPSIEIHWVVEDGWSGLLADHPDLSSQIVLPRRQWRGWIRRPWMWPRLLAGIANFRRSLQAVDADVLLDFHGNLRSGLAAGLAGTPVRLGYDGHQQKEGNRRFTTHRVPAGSRRTPRLERNLDLVRALGVTGEPVVGCDLPLVGKGRDSAADIRRRFVGDRPYAILSPGASARQASKKPPPDLLVAAGRALAEAQILPLVVWGPGEEPDAGAVVERATGDAVLAPATDLAELAALLQDARIFVGGDSGPLHLACAVGCPVVGIYGPTDPQVNQPWGVPFRTVFPRGREYTGIKNRDRRRGFEGLETEQVVEAVSGLLGATEPRHRP